MAVYDGGQPATMFWLTNVHISRSARHRGGHCFFHFDVSVLAHVKFSAWWRAGETSKPLAF